MTGRTDSPTLTGTSDSVNHQTTTHERKRTMNQLLHEDLARAHQRARLDEAQQWRRGQQLAAARRLARKAERAAAQARLALARVI